MFYNVKFALGPIGSWRWGHSIPSRSWGSDAA